MFPSGKRLQLCIVLLSTLCVGSATLIADPIVAKEAAIRTFGPRYQINGVKFSDLLAGKSVVYAAQRYAAWIPDPDKATVKIDGHVKGEIPSLELILGQDRSLQEYFGGVDVIQYDPSLPNRPSRPSDLSVLTKNYLSPVRPVSGESYIPRRTFFLLYESVFAEGYFRDTFGQIDLSRQDNLNVLLTHVNSMLEDIVVPHAERYLVSEVIDDNGFTELRAWIYFWNLNPFINTERAFDIVRSVYPVYIVAGDLPLHPPKAPIPDGWLSAQKSSSGQETLGEVPGFDLSVNGSMRLFPHPHITGDVNHQRWWQDKRWEELIEESSINDGKLSTLIGFQRFGPQKEPDRLVELQTKQVDHLKSIDALMHYAIYDHSFSGNYRELVYAYMQSSWLWKRAIDFYAPKVEFFATFTPAFDDHLVRPEAMNPPKIPSSLDEAREFLVLNSLMRAIGIFGGMENYVFDEPYEGMAIAKNHGHVLPEYEGDGLLKLIKEPRSFRFLFDLQQD